MANSCVSINIPSSFIIFAKNKGWLLFKSISYVSSPFIKRQFFLIKLLSIVKFVCTRPYLSK